MDFNAYKTPEKSELVRSLQYAVDTYQEILALRAPLDTLEKIKQDHEEYEQLKYRMGNLEFYKAVNEYLVRYEGLHSALGDLMENYGNNIDRNGGFQVLSNGRTLDEEHSIIQRAYSYDAKERAAFKKRLKYLLSNGAKDLKTFEAREATNAELYKKAIAACIDGNPEKQARIAKRKHDDFRVYRGYPTQLYLLATKLRYHLSTTHTLNEEFVASYLTAKEKENRESSWFSADRITTGNLYRVEQFVNDVTIGKIKIEGITIKNTKPDEEPQP